MKLTKTFTAIVTAVIMVLFAALPLMAAEEAAPAKKSTVLEGKLNVNTASAEQLTMLPGIGEATAKNIMDYRTQNGNFKAVDDLLKVKGIGEKTLEKMKGYVILDGESTLIKK